MVLSADNKSTPPDTLAQADAFTDKPQKKVVQWGSFVLWVCVMLSVMSQSDNEMSTLSLDMEVDVLDCYSPDLMLLCWISHSKSPPKGNFPLLISFKPDTPG